MFKNIIVHPFKQRTVGYYLGLAAAVLAIISSILLVAVDYGDKSCSMIGFALMLVGGISFVAVMFLDIKILTVIPGIFYVMGFAFELDATLPPLSDVWNGVNFIGGNAYAGLAFTIIFFISAVLSIVSNFMEHRKVEE